MVNEVIVLDSLYNINMQGGKSKNRKIPVNVARQIFEEYEKFAIAEKEGPNELNAIIKKIKSNDNGKKMASVVDIFKYRLNSGDRILYTYSANIPYLKNSHPDALVLLQYEQHDNQAFAARRVKLDIPHEYRKVTELYELIKDLVDTEEITPEELQIAVELSDPASSVYFENGKKYIVTREMLADKSCKEWQILLSPEQGECKDSFNNSDSSMMVLGGAGSGKTLLAMHILGDFRTGKAAYFTQSNELRNKTKKLFESTYPDTGAQIEFFNINEFCMNKLSLIHKGFVGYEDFCEIVSTNSDLQNLCNSVGMSTFEIWKELRGRIKGSLSKDWTRTKLLDQNDGFKYTDDLIKRGFIYRPNNDKSFALNGDINFIKNKFEQESVWRNNEEKHEMQRIINYYSAFDSDLILLPEEEYISTCDEHVSKKSATLLYDIAKEYQKILVSDHYDDNDLARLTISKLSSADEKYDLLIVDEVQDYTEMQLYLLFELAKGKMLLAGDEHQLVNPTVFTESRVEDLFYRKDRRINVVHLSENFRCHEGIVKVANSISMLRRNYIGSMSALSEAPQKADEDGVTPFRLSYSLDNLKKMAIKLLEYPRTAILVPDDACKARLIDVIGKDVYKNAENSIIFTVPEIKGMEYKYVLCYDFFNYHKDIWDRILDSDSKHQTNLRHYFNLVYVAITRAQEYLCFIDDATVNNVEEKLSLQSIDNFDSERLGFYNITGAYEEWIAQAEDYVEQGKYAEALQNYIKGNASKDKIYMCKAYVAFNSHDYVNACKYFILSGNKEKVRESCANITEDSDIKTLAALIYRDVSFNHKLLRTDLAEFIRSCYKGFAEEDIELIFTYALKAINDSIDKRFS